MDDCVFCKIINGKIPATKVFENEEVLGFKDLDPQAHIHYLFVHKLHTMNVAALADIHPEQLGPLFRAMGQIASEQNFAQSGYRVVTNVGPHAGQTVFHTHFHLLAGEQLGRFGR